MQLSGGLGHPIGQFLSWWGRELRDLVPRGTQTRARPRLVLSLDPGGVRLLREAGRRRRSIVCGPESAQIWADIEKAVSRADKRLPVGVRLPYRACLIRTLDLPFAAAKDVPRILNLDLERSTPFKARDVYTAYLSEAAADGKLRVRHIIVSRDRLDPALDLLRQAGRPATFADCWDENEGAAALPINLLVSALDPGPSPSMAPVKLLAVAAVALSLSGVALYAHKHSRALAELDSRLEAARTRAQAVRQTLERSDAATQELATLLAIKRDHISSLAVLENLTRILPDTAWITDLRVDGTTVEIVGTATAAASLLPLIEKSGQFTRAALTSPLTFLPGENKERFAIRMTVVRPPRTTQAQPGGGGE